ncbi:DUF6665 family protein [Notoacmeibacter sp. MSK16QG-6]|uniref:DUF6665 family protein n=1 Tax=Notoacmeibacter sp. MSK16QG-6 TaxID=2957982 RepID=UPI0020A08B14|nr:DUF6665 family protein [Notoacmeibacter sp. MSK16QG-6]MCP1199883.1 hypothetical protein [Notoacmeibacter sp. MSK16QG-6]
MALRPPSRYRERLSVIEESCDALGYEIAAEKASSLGRAGKAVGQAIAALDVFEERYGTDSSRLDDLRQRERRELLRTAAVATHAYFIQRELCGLRRHHDVIAFYRIPQAVLARLGAG